MDNLNIRNFESIGQLTGALEQVISGDQPLQRALTVLRDNTQPGVFSENSLPKNGRKPRQSRITSYSPASGMNSPRKTVPGSTERQRKHDAGRVSATHRVAPLPAGNPERACTRKSALKAVQLRLDQNSSDPIFATRQMAKTLPAPLNRWVGRLTDQAACGDGGGCSLYGSGLARQRGETV